MFRLCGAVLFDLICCLALRFKLCWYLIMFGVRGLACLFGLDLVAAVFRFGVRLVGFDVWLLLCYGCCVGGWFWFVIVGLWL